MKKPKAGDVFRVNVGPGGEHSYIQFLGIDRRTAGFDLFRAMNGILTERIYETLLSRMRTRFYFYASARALLHDDRFSVVCNLPTLEPSLWPPFRRRLVEGWRIEWADKPSVDVRVLDDEYLALPFFGGAPADIVVEQIVAGHAFEPREIMQKSRPATPLGKPRIRYFVTVAEQDVDSAISALRQGGYDVQQPKLEDETDDPDSEIELEVSKAKPQMLSSKLIDFEEAEIRALIAQVNGVLTGAEIAVFGG